MHTSHEQQESLRLDLVQGPEMQPVTVPPGGFANIGRAAECQVCLLHETVSRRHATLAHHGGHWFLTDVGSRHGTFVGGVRLEPNTPATLEPDDLVRIGPWTFRVRIGTPRTLPSATLHDAGLTTHRVERVPERELGWMAQHRLNLLIECSAAINAAGTEEALVAAALDAALAGSGYRRAAWLRQTGTSDNLEVLGFKSLSKESASGFVFSQSLIREAEAGQVARLTEDGPVQYGQSIAGLGIHSALCAPIVLGISVAGYLYFDARGQESPVHPEAAGFCQAISRMCGLAMSNLKRVELERRQHRLEADLSAAREAQQLILPPSHGEAGPVRYALRNKPGRTVAGDLFDVVPLDNGKVAICIGDVTGESISAGIVMATTQAYLHASLVRHQEAAAALTAVNQYLTTRCALNMFITMWVGVLDPASCILRFVDAGHGHWLLKRAGAAATRIVTPGGIPLAIEPGYAYRPEELVLSPGDRLFLYSDGLHEQRSPTGEQYGRDRIIAALAASSDVQTDVDTVFDAVQRFACTDMLDDDATAASIEVCNHRS